MLKYNDIINIIIKFYNNKYLRFSKLKYINRNNYFYISLIFLYIKSMI